MITFIDADSLCYAQAFAVEKGGEVIPNGDLFMYRKLDQAISTIIRETKADDYKVFLSGTTNFRDRVDPLYKKNRKDMKKPKLLQEARNYLEVIHSAIVSVDCEADDLVCQEQTTCLKLGVDSCIAHIDKDIDQQVGLHYRWRLRTKPSSLYYISHLEGLLNLYTQALVGDKVDNIGYYLDENTLTWKKDYGIGSVTAHNILKECTNEKEMYDKCCELYTSWTRKGSGDRVTLSDLERNMHLLYMKRTKKDKWRAPIG